MLTRDRLLEVLKYNRRTGAFTWRVGKGPQRAGSPAGTLRKDGYRQIYVDGVIYLEHRLAVFYVTGKWPAKETDHRKSGRQFRAVNRWRNLREASCSQNKMNRAPPKHNTSGVKGVCWREDRGKWVAYIGFDSKNHSLGLFVKFKDAVARRRVAERERQGDFAWR